MEVTNLFWPPLAERGLPPQVDDRVQAASVACYSSSFEVDFAWQGAADAEQVWPGGLAAGLNKADLSVARSPRATQLLLTTVDGCFPLQGGRMCFADAHTAFAALSAPGNLSKVAPRSLSKMAPRNCWALSNLACLRRRPRDRTECRTGRGAAQLPPPQLWGVLPDAC